MRNYLTTSLVLAALATLASCSSDDTATTTGPTSSSQVAIGFDGYVGRATSRTVTDATSLQNSGFGVFAYYTNGSTYDGGTGFESNLMNNFKVSGSDWTYSPLRYWPGTSTEYVSFLAYGPYNSNTTLTGTSISYDGKSDVDLVYNKNNALNQQWSMTSADATDKGNFDSNKKQKMAFAHATARINGVSITSTALKNPNQFTETPTAEKSSVTSDAKITINKITISGFPESGALDLSPNATTRWNSTGGSIDFSYPSQETGKSIGDLTGTETYVAPTEEGGTATYTYSTNTVNTGDDDAHYVIPVQGGSHTVTVTYTITYTSTSAKPSDYTATGTLTQDFKQGKSYKINIDLNSSLNAIEFTVESVDDWGADEVNPINL